MIIIFLQLMFVLTVFVIAYTQGFNDGKLEGRKAVRAYYEQREKVRV